MGACPEEVPGGQPVLRTARLLLVPLADRHLELEVQLDCDPEVLRYISGRARSRDEVVVSHAQRMALADEVDRYFPIWEGPLPGAAFGEVEYEMTRDMWQSSRGHR
jgi:hypothetical protein